jgi:hypothetical protein
VLGSRDIPAFCEKFAVRSEGRLRSALTGFVRDFRQFAPRLQIFALMHSQIVASFRQWWRKTVPTPDKGTFNEPIT